VQRAHASSIVAFATLAACGGGGGSTAPVPGLTIPAQISIVDANTGGSAALRPMRAGLGGTLTDYQRDQTRFWVHDESMGPLQIINEILCALDQTNYDHPDVINKGPYVVLVDCFSKGSEQGGDRKNQQYEEWTVDSSRASEQAPHIVKLWIPNEEDMGAGPVVGTIYVRVVIRSAPTENLPYGDFTLYFKGLSNDLPPTSTNTTFEGYLTTIARDDGQAEFAFYNGHGDPEAGDPGPGQYAMRERARVVGDPATRSGRAYTERRAISSKWQEDAEYQVQFNANYLARKDKDGVIEVLDRNDFDTHVWRYGLYDATTEARVARTGGFPVQTQAGDHGWASYHGVWFPERVTLTHGQTLIRRSHRDNTTTNYTAMVVPGRLEKRTRATITLGDIAGEEMEHWDHTNQEIVLARFDGTDWLKVATRPNHGSPWSRLEPPVNWNGNFTQGQWVHMWSPHRGSVELAWETTPLTSTPAYRWTWSAINHDSPELAGGNLSLWAYWNMLRANITQNQANWQSGETPYFPPASNVGEGRNYVFNATSLLLTLGGDPCTLASGVTVTQGPSLNGFNCGPLVATALGDLSEMNQQSVTYEWRTGTQAWNQLRALKNAQNQVVRFDPPLRMDYTHDEPGNPFHNRTFNLEWDGENLHGIPYQENPEQGRWYPMFNIPSGSVVTVGSTSYKIKQLEGEQVMVAVDDPMSVMTSEGFDLSGTIPAPSPSLWQDPAIGARPTVTAPPRFVGGLDPTVE
jgi:hypothetical protein